MRTSWGMLAASALTSGLLITGGALASGEEDHSHDHEHEERAEHYEGKEIENRSQAVETLKAVNGKLQTWLSGELTSQRMTKIHQISYTMENALPYLNGDTETASEHLEGMHLASERMEAGAVKTHGDAYLHTVRELLP